MTFTEDKLRRASVAIYLACEESVAKEISAMLQFAADLVREREEKKLTAKDFRHPDGFGT